MIQVQDVRLDPVDRRAWRGENEIAFSRKEFDLVHALISRAGDIVTREELMRDVWGVTACDGPGNVRAAGHDRQEIRGYSARGPMGQPDGFDDGTLAPTALMGSIAFAPEICVPALEALAGQAAGPWAVLIGPEGGFAPEERARLQGLDCVTAVSLGPRILRADTAAISALTLWQAALGDWR